MFFRSCWSLIKNDIMAVFHHFYHIANGSFADLNIAMIALIPKKDGAASMGDFQPISLVHSIGKLISKVLSMRLATVISKIISPAQTAFQKNKCIHDSYLYVQNTIRALHRAKTPALLLKIDIARAFDSVSWEYIIELMCKLGFPARWRDWITLLLSSSSSSCLINGIPGNRIDHLRGLRQGDPLSLLLFILCIDPLHRLLEAATRSGALSPIPGSTARMRTSLYADDAVIFNNPSRLEVDSLLQILASFGDATGLCVNLAKSSAVPISCHEIDLDHVLHGFGGATVSFPVKYLGLPLTTGRTRLVHLQFILDRIRSRLAGWKGRLLPLEGRRVLVRCVLSAIPTF
uniref:Reverse transcriptase domain-containing protein n=1 Tax=Triticum urartu TaxID=4572 RepID=A0A8R7PE15_TRIUA